MIPRVEGQETMQYGSLEAAVGLPDVEAAVIENLVSPSLGFFILAHICPDPAGLQYSAGMFFKLNIYVKATTNALAPTCA